MRAIHQSTAKVASDCLARYKAEVIDGAPTDNAFAQLGTAVHFAVERTYQKIATGNRQPIECALESLDEWWEKRDATLAPVWVYSEAETILRRAYGEDSGVWLGLPGRGQEMNVEVEWKLDDEFRPLKDGEPAYAGRFDILQWGSDGVFVRDLKTVRSMPRADDLATDFQARVYSLAALALFPDVDEVTFELLLLRHGYTIRHTFVRGEPWERQTKRWLRAVRSAVAWAHDVDEWPATPGAGCQYCPIRGTCSALGDVISGTTTAETPEDTAANYLAAKAVAADCEREARKDCEDRNVPVGLGKVLGFKPGSRKVWKYGVADLLAQLRADGATDEDLRAWFPRSSISKGAMEAAAKVLLARGEIEMEAYEYVDLLREEVPSVTFTTWMEMEGGDDE